jgi:outer membrane receptor protein involved in Fe transport
LSYSRQRYVDWVTATANFDGNDIEAAPKVLANTRLTWRPTAAAMVQLEWVRIGSYWLEAGNSPAFGKYPGHDLLNLRASYAVNQHLGVFLRIMNATDKRFADSASVSSNTPVFSPGLPRAFYAGVETKW